MRNAFLYIQSGFVAILLILHIFGPNVQKKEEKNVGGATPPSVMVLFYTRPKSCFGGLIEQSGYLV